MIHILQSVSNMDRGGIESMLMNYYRHLDRTRFQFDFLVNKKKPGFFSGLKADAPQTVQQLSLIHI